MTEKEYKVVRDFTDLNNKDSQGKGRVYRVGDVYPAGKTVPSEERINALLNGENKNSKVYIAEMDSESVEVEEALNGIEEEAEQEFEDVAEGTVFPLHTGGSWYQLSNGDKIQGETKAVEEEAKLK